MSLSARLVALAIAAVLAVGGWWALRVRYMALGAAEERAKWQAQADALTARNRELQRASELRYTVAAETRDKFIVETVTEIRYVTSHLAACPVGAPAVRMLNAAARCALGNSPAACGADQPVPGAQ